MQDFTRKGYRRRSLLTPLGGSSLSCRGFGGSVVLGFAGLVRPYQRISHLVDEQIQRWYRLDLSVRQLQTELAQSNVGLLALRTLKFRSQGFERE